MASRKPPSRRDFRYPDQHQMRWLTSTFPGAMGGRSPSTRPVDVNSGSLAAVEGGTADELFSTREFYNDDIFTLTSAGVQDLTLTYLPDPQSLHVELNGLKAKKGVDWTIADQTLSLLAPLDARVGDIVTTEYAFQSGLPTVPDDESDINIPFQSGGWSYIGVTAPSQVATYVNPATDASSWSVGTAPLGWSTFTDIDGHAKATSLPNVNTGQLGHVYDAVIRRSMPAGNDYEVTWDMSNYIAVYADGVLVDSNSGGNPLKHTTVVGDMAAPWVLAFYVTVANGGTNGGLDIEVTGTLP